MKNIMWAVLNTIRKTSITRLETTVNVQSQYLLTNTFTMFDVLSCYRNSKKKITFGNDLKFSNYNTNV